RIGQRQRRAPGSTDDHPALKAEFLADHLQIRDQMRQRVVFAPSLGTAAAGATLVEQNSMKAFRIKQPAVIRLASAAGAAMEVDRWNAANAPDALDINVVAVADHELLRGQWCERIGGSGGLCGVGVRRTARLTSTACR